MSNVQAHQHSSTEMIRAFIDQVGDAIVGIDEVHGIERSQRKDGYHHEHPHLRRG